jgi:uncharacterized protein (DUF2225 family)
MSDVGRDGLPGDLYLKEFSCPVSELKFSAVMVKSRAYSLESRDPDFRPHYRGINPLHYAVIVSPVGFAAEDSQYKRSPKMMIRDFEGLARRLRSGLRDSLTGERSVEQAARSYEMALASYEFLKVPQYEIAGMALRASWMNLEWSETENNEAGRARAAVLRRIALEKYMYAFEKEDVTKLRLGSHGVSMIVAELLREQGRYDESLRWFMRLVSDRSCAGEMLRNARNQMDLCREQRSGQGDQPGAAQAPMRHMDRVGLQLYKDQRNWLAGMLQGAPLDESAVLRGLLDALKESGLDPADFATEQQLKEWLLVKLRG